MSKFQELAPIQNQKLEKFHDYVARQMGFKDGNECPKLCKLAYEYLKWDEGIDGKMYDYFVNEGEGEGEEYAESLYVKLVEEFERCIFSYFSFEWINIPSMISQLQVLSVDSESKRLSNFVMTSTRKQELENITKDLKVRRMFSTTPVRGVPKCEHGVAEVIVPIAHSERNPVLLVVGGGIGAGKSTVLKHILNESFWMGAAANAVMVEDVERENQSSKELFVTALNEGRDVIMNSTLSWGTFVLQTIAMARKIHERRYKVGKGYKVEKDGTTLEKYWDQVEEDEKGGDSKVRKPYRIELVGVVCDPCLAVVRSIRRAIQKREATNIKSPVNVYLQLKSHKKFATCFRYYCTLVDVARLYNTNVIGQPKLIAWRSEGSKVLFDPEEINPFKLISTLKAKANSICELYRESDQVGYIWKDIAMAPERVSNLSELHTIINKIEKSAL